MAEVYDKAYFGDGIVDFKEANLSIASSAVLYGLSVYTVFHVAWEKERLLAFRLPEHYQRLLDSARIIGIERPQDWSYDDFVRQVREVMAANNVREDCFVRVSIHVDAILPGTRSRGLSVTLSMFVYEARAIVPRSGARLKTSLWRRVPDIAIPSRAKVNGAYVNSVLARQDAIDSGYDDCIFLDAAGHVCELSAANIFIVRGGTLVTPDTYNDLLEGINRRSIIELARELDIAVAERAIDLTELYVAEEVFISGTSAFVTPVKEVDARPLPNVGGSISDRLRKLHEQALRGTLKGKEGWLTNIGRGDR